MPIGSIGFRQPAVETLLPRMLMPKTTVDENCLLILSANDVGLAREFVGMQAESVAEPMHNRPNNQLWLHPSRSNAPHVLGTPVLRKLIHTSKRVEHFG